MFDTFNQPLGELQLRDGFALIAFTIGDEDLKLCPSA